MRPQNVPKWAPDRSLVAHVRDGSGEQVFIALVTLHVYVDISPATHHTSRPSSASRSPPIITAETRSSQHLTSTSPVISTHEIPSVLSRLAHVCRKCWPCKRKQSIGNDPLNTSSSHLRKPTAPRGSSPARMPAPTTTALPSPPTETASNLSETLLEIKFLSGLLLYSLRRDDPRAPPLPPAPARRPASPSPPGSAPPDWPA